MLRKHPLVTGAGSQKTRGQQPGGGGSGSGGGGGGGGVSAMDFGPTTTYLTAVAAPNFGGAAKPPAQSLHVKSMPAVTPFGTPNAFSAAGGNQSAVAATASQVSPSTASASLPAASTAAAASALTDEDVAALADFTATLNRSGRGLENSYDTDVLPYLQDRLFKTWGIKSQLKIFMGQQPKDKEPTVGDFIGWLAYQTRITGRKNKTPRPVLKRFTVSGMARPPWPEDIRNALGQKGNDIRHVVRNATLKAALGVEFNRLLRKQENPLARFYEMAQALGVPVNQSAGLSSIIPAIYKQLYLNTQNLFSGESFRNRIIGFAADPVAKYGRELMAIKGEAMININGVAHKVMSAVRDAAQKQGQKDPKITELMRTIIDEIDEIVWDYLCSLPTVGAHPVSVYAADAREVGLAVLNIGLGFGFDLHHESNAQLGSMLVSVETELQDFVATSNGDLTAIFAKFLGKTPPPQTAAQTFPPAAPAMAAASAAAHLKPQQPSPQRDPNALTMYPHVPVSATPTPFVNHPATHLSQTPTQGAVNTGGSGIGSGGGTAYHPPSLSKPMHLSAPHNNTAAAYQKPYHPPQHANPQPQRTSSPTSAITLAPLPTHFTVGTLAGTMNTGGGSGSSGVVGHHTQTPSMRMYTGSNNNTAAAYQKPQQPSPQPNLPLRRTSPPSSAMMLTPLQNHPVNTGGGGGGGGGGTPYAALVLTQPLFTAPNSNAAAATQKPQQPHYRFLYS